MKIVPAREWMEQIRQLEDVQTADTPPMDHKIKRPYGRWVPACATDIRKTFERARANLKTKGK